MADGDGRDIPGPKEMAMVYDILHQGMPNLRRESPAWAAAYARQLIDLLLPALGGDHAIDIPSIGEPRAALPIPTPPKNHLDEGRPRTRRVKADEAELPCIYSKKGMVAEVFEFLVLRRIEFVGDGKADKADIHDQFTKVDALEVGKFPAFCTRIATLKEDEWIEWPTNKQRARLSLSLAGRTRLKALLATELKQAHKDYLAKTIDWSGLREDD